MCLLSGFAKINDLGVKVLEAGVELRSGSPLIRASEPKLLGSNKRRSQRSLRLIITLAFLAVYLLIGVAVRLLRHALTNAARTDPKEARTRRGRKAKDNAVPVLSRTSVTARAIIALGFASSFAFGFHSLAAAGMLFSCPLPRASRIACKSLRQVFSF